MTFLLICFYSSFKVNFAFPFFLMMLLLNLCIITVILLACTLKQRHQNGTAALTCAPGCRFALPFLIDRTELCLLLQLVLEYHLQHQWK